MIFNILKANLEIKSLNSKVEDLAKHNEQLVKQVEELKQREATFSIGSQDWATEKENLIKGHEEAIKAIEEKHAKEILDFNKQLKDVETSASRKAADIVSSIGVAPETVGISPNEIAGNGMVKSPYKVITHKQ